VHALYRAGRQADALAAYERARAVLLTSSVGPFAGRSVLRLVLDADGEVVSEEQVFDAGFREDFTELCAVLAP